MDQGGKPRKAKCGVWCALCCAKPREGGVDNGQTAVDRVLEAREKSSPFDVVLMDMQMPVLDGYAVTRRLRDSGITSPIIALTAHAMASDRKRCLRAGCTDYATAPIQRTQLLKLVASYLKPASRSRVLQTTQSGNQDGPSLERTALCQWPTARRPLPRPLWGFRIVTPPLLAQRLSTGLLTPRSDHPRPGLLRPGYGRQEGLAYERPG